MMNDKKEEKSLLWKSPTPIQLESLTIKDDTILVSASRLFGNEWYGELRMFGLSEKVDGESPTVETTDALRISVGSACSTMTNNLVMNGRDDGNVLTYRRNVENQTFQHDPICCFEEHMDIVSCLSANSNGSLLATGGWDKVVNIFDLHNGSFLSTMNNQFHDRIVDVQFCQNNLLAVAEKCGRISMMDIRQDQQSIVKSRTFNGPMNVLCPSFDLTDSSDNFMMIGMMDGNILEWNFHTDEIQSVRQHHNAIQAMAVNPSTQVLLSGSSDGSIYSIPEIIHQDFIKGAAWWKDYPITCSWDGTIRCIV